MRAWLILLPLAVAPGVAAEPDMEAAKKHYAEGSSRYEAGRHMDALASFEEAYKAAPLPGFLFNIGQCHRKLNQHRRALENFERYLKEKPDATNRVQVENLIVDLRTLVEKKDAADLVSLAATGETETIESIAVVEEPTSSSVQPSSEVPHQEQTNTEPAFYEQWWFWTVTGGAATAAAATAVVILAFTLPGEEVEVLPYGSLGTLDRRGY